jgi:putative Mg2+ transporter-C (MgtC) family protein
MEQFYNNPLIVPVWLSLLCGFVIGITREMKHKDAGIRTITMVCLGACLYTYLGTRIDGVNDTSRVIAQIVSGIGFLGGGVIFKDKDYVAGLTSAAIIWLVGAIGILCGLQMYFEAAMSSATILVVDVAFGKIKGLLNNDI